MGHNKIHSVPSRSEPLRAGDNVLAIGVGLDDIAEHRPRNFGVKWAALKVH